MKNIDDAELLRWARFVATKFSTNVQGWKYTRDLGDLVHIRFKRDYTGYNHWTSRMRRAFNWKHLTGRDRLSLQIGLKPKNFMDGLLSAWAWIVVCLRKEKNLPDGRLNGNIVFWEEDGEYGALFGPTVGVKVLDFIEAEPENPHAVEILAEMKRMALLSFSEEEKENESS